MTDGKELSKSHVQCCFQVLLAVDRLQAATVYTVAHELGYTRHDVQTALRVAVQQFGVVFARVGPTYQIIEFGVLNKAALYVFMAERLPAKSISAKQSQDHHGLRDETLHPPNDDAEMESVTGITRIDHEASSTKAWHVALNRASGRLDRTFSDGVYGGKAAAYRAAIDWRDQAVAKSPLMPRIERVSAIRKNNQSGVSGVYRWPGDGGMAKEMRRGE
jgi:hypothetical protein